LKDKRIAKANLKRRNELKSEIKIHRSKRALFVTKLNKSVQHTKRESWTRNTPGEFQSIPYRKFQTADGQDTQNSTRYHVSDYQTKIQVPKLRFDSIFNDQMIHTSSNLYLIYF
jgi:hypothetical protein